MPGRDLLLLLRWRQTGNRSRREPLAHEIAGHVMYQGRYGSVAGYAEKQI